MFSIFYINLIVFRAGFGRKSPPLGYFSSFPNIVSISPNSLIAFQVPLLPYLPECQGVRGSKHYLNASQTSCKCLSGRVLGEGVALFGDWESPKDRKDPSPIATIFQTIYKALVPAPISGQVFSGVSTLCVHPERRM